MFVIDDIIDDVLSDAVELIEDTIDDIGLGNELAGQSPIIRLVNCIIYSAVKDGASDIHIEPTECQIRVRYRVDGALFKFLELPAHIAPAIASRIKIMASMDISERRLPQDGRIHVMMENRSSDLSVSTLPLAHGEKTVIRIMENPNIPLSLAQRLCRRICAECKQAYEPLKAILSVMQHMGLESNEFYRGVGFAECRLTGFSGRVAIHELLVVDDVRREAICVSPTIQTVNEYARRAGMIPPRYDGLRKVKEGLTTIEEVLQSSDEGWLPVKS